MSAQHRDNDEEGDDRSDEDNEHEHEEEDDEEEEQGPPLHKPQLLLTLCQARLRQVLVRPLPCSLPFIQANPLCRPIVLHGMCLWVRAKRKEKRMPARRGRPTNIQTPNPTEPPPTLAPAHNETVEFEDRQEVQQEQDRAAAPAELPRATGGHASSCA